MGNGWGCFRTTTRVGQDRTRKVGALEQWDVFTRALLGWDGSRER